MNFWLFLIPLLSAILGWVFNKFLAVYLIGRYFDQQQGKWAVTIGHQAEKWLPLGQLEEKITHPALIESAMPSIEAHIDDFLNVQLPKEIPMLGMFIGDKTTGKVKEVFISQLKTLFPKVMGDITSQLKHSFSVSTLVQTELEKPAVWKAIREKGLSPLVQRLALAGMLLGFLTGIINLFLFYWMQ